ncbi:RidA family protein [Methanoculleus sp. FWC-SCC1]|uniref:RidA family protein n=1 Tax=Methanoculleus frigidifontis TaxID=2584085 RepID=A0ABT8MB49_9EURY|nr:RidA family protein [Methanoculleus sp. FWC-SCC1]MDN7025111.1 RidA family protein [Methanoculleus sp. FWC-SCC1]
MNRLEYINPAGMTAPRGYSHAVSVSGDHTTVYIGGQNAVDENGLLVGNGNLGEQTGQVLDNIEKIVNSAGARIGNVIKLTIYVRQGQNPQEGFQAFQKKWPADTGYPAITVLFVAGLAHPDWLVEIDAVAVIPAW